MKISMNPITLEKYLLPVDTDDSDSINDFISRNSWLRDNFKCSNCKR